jgi:hypothetical protein
MSQTIGEATPDFRVDFARLYCPDVTPAGSFSDYSVAVLMVVFVLYVFPITPSPCRCTSSSEYEVVVASLYMTLAIFDR